MGKDRPRAAGKAKQLPEGVLGSRKEQVRVRTERFRSVYVNNVAFSMSTFDVSILLGEIVGEKDDQPVIEELLKVNMSRELAKALAVILGQNLLLWEQKFGEIQIPDLAAANAEEDQPAASIAKDAAELAGSA